MLYSYNQLIKQLVILPVPYNRSSRSSSVSLYLIKKTRPVFSLSQTGHHVRLSYHGAINSCHILAKRPYNTASLTLLLQIGGQEAVNHAYKRNFKEHTVGIVKVGVKIQKL